MANLSVGTRVHYTGDMANMPAVGTITEVYSDRWGNHIRIVWDEEDGEQKPESVVSPANFGKTLSHRFWTMDDWQADRNAKIAQMQRDCEARRK